MRWPKMLACALAVLSLGSCGDGADTATLPPWPKGDSTYVFTQPDARFELADDLDEISGLALLDDGRLAAVQDELGNLYILDPSSGQIVEVRRFAERGDYEAVDVVDGTLLVLRSDGRLLRFADRSGNEITGDYLDLNLPRRCDAEGLRYDPPEGRLLVSCKDEPGPNLEREKAVFAFNLDGTMISDRPMYVIDPRRFTASIKDHPVNEAVRSVLSDRVDLSGFRPSELAIHPVTGEIYVLSSVRESIISIDRRGSVTGIWELPDSLLEQPEGLVFLPNGDMFIASEAGNRRNGVLLRYNNRAPAKETQE